MFKKQDRQVDLEIFTIFDSKVGAYEVPTYAINQHDLVRQIINMFQDPAQSKNKFLINAEDFSIYKIGGYDKKTGQIASQNLEHVANLHDLRSIAQKKPDLGIVPT